MVLDEKSLIQVAKPYFDHCRAGDWNHALRVVKWVRELGEGREDIDIILAAAYIHDIGWSGVIPAGKVDFDEMLKYELQANTNTDKYVREVLMQLHYNELDILTVIRLIGAADKHQSTQDDEAVLVDADNLSKLCLEHLQEKYQPESYGKLIKYWEEELSGRIATLKGKKVYPRLLANLKSQLN